MPRNKSQEGIAATLAPRAIEPRTDSLEQIANALLTHGPFVIWTPTTSTGGSPPLPNALIISSGGQVSIDVITAPGFVRLNIAPDAILGGDIANDEVSFSKMQNVDTARVLGRATAGTGDIEELTLSQVLDLLSTTQGTILFRGAAGWQALAPGTAGQVLTSGGAGADPSWV